MRAVSFGFDASSDLRFALPVREQLPARNNQSPAMKSFDVFPLRTLSRSPLLITLVAVSFDASLTQVGAAHRFFNSQRPNTILVTLLGLLHER